MGAEGRVGFGGERADLFGSDAVRIFSILGVRCQVALDVGCRGQPGGVGFDGEDGLALDVERDGKIGGGFQRRGGDAVVGENAQFRRGHGQADGRWREPL